MDSTTSEYTSFDAALEQGADDMHSVSFQARTLTSQNTQRLQIAGVNLYQGLCSEFIEQSALSSRHPSLRFTGSAGTAIISRSGAHLFTDSRYYVQATRELDSNWMLHKVGMSDIQPWNEWLKDRPRGSRIGVDSRLVSHGKHIDRNSRLGCLSYCRGHQKLLLRSRQRCTPGIPSLSSLV